MELIRKYLKTKQRKLGTMQKKSVKKFKQRGKVVQKVASSAATAFAGKSKLAQTLAKHAANFVMGDAPRVTK